MTTPIKQASFPPYKGPEESSPQKEDQTAFDVVDRVIRYGGGISPFVSTGPKHLTKLQALALLWKAKKQLDADYREALNVVRGEYKE